MTPQEPNPFSDDLPGDGDPLAPEKAFILTPDGELALNAKATMESYEDSQLPRLDASQVQVGDHLSIEFDDDTQQTYEITKNTKGSLAFGSEDIIHPVLTAIVAPSEDSSGSPVVLVGSCVGNLLSSGRFTVDQQLMTISPDYGTDVSEGTIRYFSLKRPSKEGVLEEVRLNKTPAAEAHTESYDEVREAFDSLTELLASQAFAFDQLREHEFPERFRRMNDNGLLYASRESIGSKTEPRDVIQVYDVEHQILRSLRSIPGRGIMQMAVIHGASPKLLADITSYEGSEQEGWKGLYDAYVNVPVHLAKSVPFVTYSWRGASEEPIVTAVLSGEVAGITAPDKHENDAEELSYPTLEVDIATDATGKHATVKSIDSNYWIENSERWQQEVQDGLELHEQGPGRSSLTLGRATVEYAERCTDDLKEMRRLVADLVAHPQGN